MLHASHLSPKEGFRSVQTHTILQYARGSLQRPKELSHWPAPDIPELSYTELCC